MACSRYVFPCYSPLCAAQDSRLPDLAFEMASGRRQKSTSVGGKQPPQRTNRLVRGKSAVIGARAEYISPHGSKRVRNDCESGTGLESKPTRCSRRLRGVAPLATSEDMENERQVKRRRTTRMGGGGKVLERSVELDEREGDIQDGNAVACDPSYGRLSEDGGERFVSLERVC
jgi:hypothetical protein